ncbi:MULTISPECIES: hypothetical protein [unclassified Curtobacterium]|uniref:hypothetical protein n=1 Tax=unclassified Curtobacterium TaxID=257496 RepID=UPI0008DD9F37|nr:MULTISPECIES: hypothetical protein [unclassified Curtobacterium]OIH96896.1 hypothetical protein BIU92_04105 [Curtobacterium sp. MCBA15_003]OII09394.1 hypothetical protein BIU97_12835 [Curtobacterium sp. MCBA15_009]OII31084.1 hypothetical protein BIU94_05300 [Curtobacterium sp. MMLR14_006]
MDWWNDLSDWTASDDGWRVLSGAVIPFVAIVVAGVIAALIGRGATKRVVALQEREAKNAAVTAIVSAARKAAAWGALGHDERRYADHLAEDADIRLRLLPVPGAPLAANWTQHEIADIKKNSSTFSFQAEQSLAEFRDRLLDWQARPSRARKLFKADLERWKFDSPDPDAELIKRQQDWNADQVEQSRAQAATPAPASPAERPTPTTTSLRPAATPTPAAAPTGTGTGTGTPSGTGTAGSAGTLGGAGTHGSPASAPQAPQAPQSQTPAQGPSTPAFSVNRGGSDADATRSFGQNTTRVYGDDPSSAPTPPVRPTLGTPAQPARTTPGSTGPAGASGTSRDTDDTEVVDDRATTQVFGGSAVTPTAAESHVNRTPANDVPARAPRLDAAGTTNTTSIPTRLSQAPAEPTDADETSEATHTQPISAAELRRRAADDE